MSDLKGRDFLSVADLNADELAAVLDGADVARDPGRDVRRKRGGSIT